MKDKFIWSVKVSDKGQISIPKEAREVFNINTGDSLIMLGDLSRGLALVKFDEYLDLAKAIMNIYEGDKNDWN